MLFRLTLLIAALLFIGCAHDATAAVKEGQPAPDVDLPATQIGKSNPAAKDAKTLKLKDLQGKKHVVLFFYPKALTGG